VPVKAPRYARFLTNWAYISGTPFGGATEMKILSESFSLLTLNMGRDSNDTF